MQIDDLVKELESAYWLTVHNNADDSVRRMTFGNYQMAMVYYFTRGIEPTNEYLRIHEHFYSHECHRRGDR